MLKYLRGGTDPGLARPPMLFGGRTVPEYGERIMKRNETIVLGVFIGIMVPLSLFILSILIVLHLSIYPFQERDIPFIAFTCLGFGIILTAARLKSWIRKFYKANLILMSVIYLCWSAVAVAIFMGVPLGNLIWGTIAGFYIGRRRYHEELSLEVFKKSARNAGIFTGLITGIEALPIGLFAFGQDESGLTTNLFEIAVVILLCLILFVMQFLLTRWAARRAFGVRKI